MRDLYNENTKSINLKSENKTFQSEKNVFDKELCLMENDQLKCMEIPINKANYKANHRDIYKNWNNGFKKTGRPKKDPKNKAMPTDRLDCEICGGQFTRYNRSCHNKTKVHMAYVKMNNKLRDLLINK
jgi:hypothetical protein